MVEIQRALISVSDKTDLTGFARALHEEFGVEILSTGGTARALRECGIPVVEVSDLTEFPELFAGRVKTLHPRIHGGLLAHHGDPEHRDQMRAHGIPRIDLVAVNLYPFEAVTASRGGYREALESVDIGGPALLRAAAKNQEGVVVIVDTADYNRVLGEMRSVTGTVSGATRFALARKAFEHTARYDDAIANYLSRFREDGSWEAFPATLNLAFEKVATLRYGENPHQGGAFYRNFREEGTGVATASQLQGKELSFNNLSDLDAALAAAEEFAKPACVIVKHANPCGAAEAESGLEAYRKAFACDPTSAFGGVIAFNCQVDQATVQAILEQQYVEGVHAPAYSQEALALFATKPAIRVLQASAEGRPKDTPWEGKWIAGGLLLQDRDLALYAEDRLQPVTQRAPTESEWEALFFAWRVVKHVKSNAIVYAKDCATVGIGAGQMSRVDAARFAAWKARSSLVGSVMASEAFFPFRDGLDAAAEVGCSAVIQPGGSVRDQEVIEAADERDIAMVMTGMRHFRH